MSHHRRNAELTQLQGKQQRLICQLKMEKKPKTTTKKLIISHKTSAYHLCVVRYRSNKVSTVIKYTFKSSLICCLLNIYWKTVFSYSIINCTKTFSWLNVIFNYKLLACFTKSSDKLKYVKTAMWFNTHTRLSKIPWYVTTKYTH